MRLPNIWGQDIMFGFSGLEGETDFNHSLIGNADLSEPDVILRTKLVSEKASGRLWDTQPLALRFGIEPGRWNSVRRRCVASDAVDVTFAMKEGGKQVRVAYLFLSRDVITGVVEAVGVKAPAPWIESGSVRKSSRPGKPALVRTASGFFCLAVERSRFLLGFDSGNAAVAQRKAREGLNADFSICLEKKKNFFESSKVPANFSVARKRSMKSLYAKALSILKVNVESAQGKIPCRWTTPDRFPHACMWLWDSAFHVLGLRLFDPALAEDSIRAVLSCQRADGFVSLYANPTGILSQKQTQPPILAWGAWKAYEASGSKRFLEEIYPALCRYVRWDEKNKDSDQDGLMEWGTGGSIRCKGGESGMDNSPRFDSGVQVNALDFNCFLAREAEELARIARVLGKSADAAFWTKWRAKIVKRINERLWCPHEKTYYDRYVGSGLLRIKTEVMFLPLFAGVADRRQAGYLLERLTDPHQFWTPLPLPSVSADENTFTDDMWRGPVWLNYNYLVIEGLVRYGYWREAREMRARTLDHVHHWYRKTGCIWEFYDPMGRVPPPQLHRKGWIRGHGGNRFGTLADYGWSASVTAALLAMEI